MRILLLIPLVYLAAVVETSLVDLVRVGEVAPDLLALLAMLWLLTAAGPRGFLTAGAVALAGDLVSPGRLGVGAFWMLLIGYAICRLRLRARFDHFAIQILLLFLSITIWEAGVGLTQRLLGEIVLPIGTILLRAGGVGLYTAGIAVPVLMVLSWARAR